MLGAVTAAVIVISGAVVTISVPQAATDATAAVLRPASQ
jgi:hypothetical protein